MTMAPHSPGRFPPLAFTHGANPSETRRAALELINELNAERRISTPEVRVLLAGMFDLPMTLRFPAELQQQVRQDRSGSGSASP